MNCHTKLIAKAIQIADENTNSTQFKLGAVAVFKGKNNHATGKNSNDKQYVNGLRRFSIHAEIEACNNLIKTLRNRKLFCDLKRRLQEMHFELIYEYVRNNDVDKIREYISFFRTKCKLSRLLFERNLCLCSSNML